MKTTFKTITMAAMLATTGFAFAQGQGPTGEQSGMAGEGRMHHMSPEKMESMMAKRNTELKAKLKITPEQESAWSTFTSAMKPTGKHMEQQRTERAELAKLPTPERLDKMRTLRNQQMADMNAQMDKRDEATKTFYATLSAEQKKTFDNEFARMGRHHGAPAAK